MFTFTCLLPIVVDVLDDVETSLLSIFLSLKFSCVWYAFEVFFFYYAYMCSGGVVVDFSVLVFTLRLLN